VFLKIREVKNYTLVSSYYGIVDCVLVMFISLHSLHYFSLPSLQTKGTLNKTGKFTGFVTIINVKRTSYMENLKRVK